MTNATRALLISCIAILPVGLTARARASLHVQEMAGEKVTLDDATGLYWYWDMEALDNKTWAEQLAAIDDLNSGSYFRFDDWHVADYNEMSSLWENPAPGIQSAFNPTLISGNQYWYGRYDSVPSTPPGEHYYAYTYTFGSYPTKINLEVHSVGDGQVDDNMGVWAVSGGHIVPEPSSAVAWLLLSGSGGLLWAWRRRFHTLTHT